MNGTRFLRRFLVRGVYWRLSLNWAVNNIPFFFEPIVMFFWSAFFTFFARPGRKAVNRNLRYVLPGSTRFGNAFRAFRVYWNFAWSLGDSARYNQQKSPVDWEFVGHRRFLELVEGSGGAIILTAHMGNYDLGSHLFVEKMNRKMTVVRAPEVDAETENYVAQDRDQAAASGFRVNYNVTGSALALELVQALSGGEIVAIQGDRVTRGVAATKIDLFGVRADIPTGPFALAMAARVPLYPLFVIRRGRRRYQLLTCDPIRCERTSRDRDRDLDRAITEWRDQLERVIREHWFQWFMFEPLGEPL